MARGTVNAAVIAARANGRVQASTATVNKPAGKPVAVRGYTRDPPRGPTAVSGYYRKEPRPPSHWKGRPITIGSAVRG